ncbi:MAG: rod shape-determining protein MreC, partial [Actinomycetota bacterium]
LVITLDFRSGSGGILKQAKEWSVAIVAPVQRGFTTVFRPVGDFFSSLGDIPDLRDRNRELEEDNRTLLSENDRYDVLLEENQRLSDLLDLQEDWSAMESVAARVYAPDPGNYGIAVYIDKGTSDGLKPNMPVVSPEGLVGKTLRVTSHDTLVLLLADPGGGAGARIEDVRDTGTVQGNGIGQPLTMSRVGKNSNVDEGDEVLTSGLDGVFPPNIPIGEVMSAETIGGDTTKTIDVEGFVDPQKLDVVLVLLTRPERVGGGGK